MTTFTKTRRAFGFFSKDFREYILTDPFTPRPWHNYLANDIYLANLTQFGTGASFYQPKGEGLRTNVTEDRDGNGGPRYVYIRDNDSREYWTVSGAPSHTKYEMWSCRVGMGYQVNTSLHNGIEAEWRVFVPQTNDPCELWTIRVKNCTDHVRNISVFPYVEMHLTGGSTLMDFIAVLGGFFDEASRAVFCINSCVKFPPRFKAFLASDAEVTTATVSRDEFIGAYRDYRNPIAVETAIVHNTEAGTEWLGASLQHQFSIPAHEEVVFHCIVGVVESVDEGREMISRYLTQGVVDHHFEQLQLKNERLCEQFVVETPSTQFDRWMNVWLKHQLAFVARWGRVIGRGYRDILQDTFAHRILDPHKAKECILEVFSKQFPSGKCIRAWRLPHGILDLQDYADSPSWMIMALSYYLKETGDWEILEHQVPYLNPEDPYAHPTSKGTVWEHALLAQRYLLQHLGEHGLSKIYYGDWCDTMNGVGRAGKGESVMLSMQVKWGCDLLAELAQRLNHPHIAEEMMQAGAKLAAAINEQAWDGEWYVRAFDDEGVPVGSNTPPEGDNGEGRIFLNAQSWSIISGVAPTERWERAVASTKQYLDTGYGMVLNWPAFTSLKPRIGQMSAMTPGFYENGSVYVHGNCFWIFALAAAGLGNDSWDAFRAILPDTSNKPNGDTEPFVIPNYYIGPDVARRKQRNLYLSGWRTGSASWLYMTGLEWILGVRAEFDGLKIDPRLPDGWYECKVRRPFRGDVYNITIERAKGQPSRVKELFLDDQPISGSVIPHVGDGAEHQVRVVLGG